MSILPITHHIDRASFSIWSKDEIHQISVKQITDPRSFDKGGVMNPDGLYSHDLGAIKRFETCTTCGLNNFDCPGHYGHIDLSVPVFHPMLIQTTFQILNKCCLECFHFRLSPPLLKLFLAQLDALNCGFDHLIEELDEIAMDLCKDKSCDGDSYLHVLLGKKLVSRIEEEKEKTPDFDCIKRPQQRSIVERLSKLFRSFINGQLIKPSKLCPNCSEKKLSISLHHQSVMMIGTNSSKPMTEDKNSARKIARGRKKRVIDSESTNLPKVGHLHLLKTDEKTFLTPAGARHFLRQVWKNEKRTMQRIFHFLNLDEYGQKLLEETSEKTGDSETTTAEKSNEPKVPIRHQDQFQPVDLFFIETILVPPSKYRPPMSQNGYSFEGSRTAALSNVMKQHILLQDLMDQFIKEVDEVVAEQLQVKVQTAWKNLQIAVNILFDNEMDKYGKAKYPGLKQLIDKKEGLFRKNMMGKRVNFAARSVISPDPLIAVDQIGVPLVFAKKLTYPQPVAPWNLQQMKDAVLNGPDKYPGAFSVVTDDGVTIALTKESTRQAVASRLSYNPRYNRHNPNKQDTAMVTIVNRHLLTGDVLLFNRQPTLHKPSIMAFRARVLPNEKGFRLHYANCKSFNADFDGDEMNAHLPQSELARSEAYNIASVNYQYLVPKDGTPLGGLIQDHVVAVCIMTDRDQFFDQERYNQLVYSSLGFLERRINLEPPAIMRPARLWTGKQIVTTIIKNCIPSGKLPPTLNIKSKIGPKILDIPPEYEQLSDCHVIIRNGELMTGFIDKSNIGATQYGLVHICYELYGGETSSAIMSAFARLSTLYLQLYEGFTLGIGDIIVEDDANFDRKKLITASLTVGPNSAREALGLSEDSPDDKLEEKMREAHGDRTQALLKKLDASMKKRTDKCASEISARCLPKGLIRRFPDNNLQMMIQSGAKGGTVNALQISCLLGQIELEGRRVPLSMSGRTLPSFRPYDTSPKAGGFVSGRFLTGIQPQEFFFHCMAGREGLIDTAVKTSRSGYLQRCLIKHLEGITVHYDQTVRDSCGSVIQFLYGEDGLDIVKSQMLKDKAFPALIENYNIIKPGEDEMEKLNKAKENYEEDVISRTNDIQKWLEQNGSDRIRNIRGSGFLDFLASKLSDVEEGLNQRSEVAETTVKSEADLEIKETTLTEGTTTGSQSRIGSHHHDQIFDSWYALSFKEKRKWNKFWEPCPDPLTSIMNPASHFGVVPEKLDEKIEEFVRKNPNLIVDSATLLGDSRDNLGTFIAVDENPDLSKSILTHWNQSIAAIDRPRMTKHEFYNLCYNLYLKMLAQPGEAVGLLAAQSIGEPSTQMTLNTFHFAGRGEMNVTLGIPRLREILMTASAKIGTPSMDLPLLKVMKDEFGNELDEQATEEQANRVKLALNSVRLSDVLEYVDITEQVVQSTAEPIAITSQRTTRKRAREAAELDNRQQNRHSVRYDITFVLLPSKYYKHEFKCSSSKALKFIEETFVSQLTDAMSKRLKRLSIAEGLFDLSTKRMNQTRTKSSGAGAADGNEQEADNDPEEEGLDDYNAKANANEKTKEEESSSEEEDDVEGDNTAQRLKSRRNQDLDYEEPEDDDLEVGDVEATTAQMEEPPDNDVIVEPDDEMAPGGSATAGGASGNSKQDDHNDAGGGGPSVATAGQLSHSEPAASDKQAKRSKKKRWCTISLYAPITTTRLDMGALIEAEAKRTYIHRVGNIQRALIVKDVDAKARGAKCDKMIKTEGVSLLSLVRYNHILDLNSIYSNDIHAIANTYGIEAASQAIRREMANVFAVYGIEVDPRHLSLIADYMTYNGSIRGMNRMSMEASASPFQQMSFESTIRYLKWAAILGLYDDIKSPSAALVFGRPTRGGTGQFTLLQDSAK